MKKYILLLILIFVCCGKQSEKNQNVVSVLSDTTEDTFLARINDTILVSKLGINQNIWEAYRFRFGTLNSLVHNKREAFYLENENPLFGNELQRKYKVKLFKTQISKLLAQSNNKEDSNSSIWLPLIEEIKAQQQLPNAKSTLYLFSDLQENTSWFSIYNPKDKFQLEKNSSKIVALFLKQLDEQKSNNSQLKVVVVFQPRNQDEDASFTLMKGLYKKLFNHLNIPIEFTSNLTID